MNISPNLNLKITIHQAVIDSSISALSLNSQIHLTYNGVTVSTKTKSEIIPIWEESYDFEYASGHLEVILVHSPLLLKEIIIGKCLIPADSGSGWFELKSSYGKTGSIRLSIEKEDFTTQLDEEYRLKFLQLQVVHEQINNAKEKYQKRLAKLKKHKQKLRYDASKDTLKDTSNLHKQPSISHTDTSKLKYMLKLQEENLTLEREKIDKSWKDIAKEKKDLEQLQQKIKSGCTDLQNFRVKVLQKSNSRSYINSPQTATKSPLSSKSSSRISELSYTQPRSMMQLECENILHTPVSKLIKFE